MKIRTDFVTNSSSSSFVTVKLTIEEKKEICFEGGEVLDTLNEEKMLQNLLELKSVEELMNYLEVSEEDCTYQSKELSLEELSIDDIQKVRVTSGFLPGGDLSDILEDYGIDTDTIDDWESEETRKMLQETIPGLGYNWEGDYMIASATEYDLKAKTVKSVPVDPDDTYGSW